MASVPLITLLKPEDFPNLTSASKGELEKLFRALNTAFTGIVAAFTHKLSFGDNMFAFTRIVNVNSPTPIPPAQAVCTIKNTLGVRPLCVLIAEANDVTGNPRYATQVVAGPPLWTISNDGIAITSIPGLTAGRSYDVKFLVVGG